MKPQAWHIQDPNRHMTMAQASYFTTYSNEAWELWLKSFSMQTGIVYKVCTGKNVNKEANIGVLNMNRKLVVDKVLWQKQYMYHCGGKARYNKGGDKQMLSHAMLPDKAH